MSDSPKKRNEQGNEGSAIQKATCAVAAPLKIESGLNKSDWRDGLSPARVKSVESSISALFSTTAICAAISGDGYATGAIECLGSLRIPPPYLIILRGI